ERGQAGLIEIADGIVEIAPGLKPVGAIMAGLELLGLVEILASRKGALAGPGHDHGLDARILIPIAQDLGDLGPHRRVPGVELVRLVEGQGGETLAHLDQNGALVAAWHGPSPSKVTRSFRRYGSGEACSSGLGSSFARACRASTSAPNSCRSF